MDVSTGEPLIYFWEYHNHICRAIKIHKNRANRISRYDEVVLSEALYFPSTYNVRLEDRCVIYERTRLIKKIY